MPDWSVGDSAEFSKTITDADVTLFVAVSGDTNPFHVDAEFAAQTRFGRRLVHGMLTASFISTVIGTKIPGTGVLYLGQTLRFTEPVFIGDTVTARATITAYDSSRGRMTLATTCRNQHGDDVLVGEAEVSYRPPARE